MSEITVTAGQSLQAALDAAQSGDVLLLQAGDTFTGNFHPKSGVTITSTEALPPRRLTPADAHLLPTVRSGNGESAWTGRPDLTDWKLVGLRLEANAGGYGEIIQVAGSSLVDLDRLLIISNDPAGQKRAVQGNGKDITLRRSHVANIWRAGQDAQAFCAWDGAGPYTVVDNYLEAGGENVMFGGANSQSAAHVPADILVEGNHCTKREEWRGQARAVKNLFELKSAKRVIVRHNLFEKNWGDAQGGTAIQLTVRNDEGGAPWSVIEDVLFEHNTIRDTVGIFNILGYNDGDPSGRTTRLVIRHNLCLGTGYFAQMGGEIGELTFDHNTIEQDRNFFTMYVADIWPAGEPGKRPAKFAVEKLIVTNTLAYHREYGVFGEQGGIGTPALDAMATGYQWTHNVLAGPTPFPYPDVTWKPTVEDHAAQFTPEYRLIPTSVYRKAGTDGQDLGVVSENGGGGTEPPAKLPISVQWEGKTFTGVLDEKR